MRILIIGSNGMLGKYLPQEWTEDEVIPSTSREADIRDFGQVRQLVTQAHPDWIVLTAAYTDVDGSKQNSELAFAVNGEGMKTLACVAQEDGARVFSVSRDYLVDGNHPIEPERPIAPLNVYGRSKAAGEKAIQENHSAWCIAGTSWLFGAPGAFPREDLTRFGDTSGIDRGGGSIRFTFLHPRSCRRDPRPGPYGWARDFARHQHRILFLVRVCTIHHDASKTPSQAFRRFGPFTGEPLCSWHDVAQWHQGHRGV